jgi:hypothetical protein
VGGDRQSSETTAYRNVHAPKSESLEETKNLRRSRRADPEISAERVVLDVPFDDAEEDDQEVTAAFRPSRILRDHSEASGSPQGVESSAIVHGTISQSGVNARRKHFWNYTRPPRRALARLAQVMALIALVVWGLSHLLVRM